METTAEGVPRGGVDADGRLDIIFGDGAGSGRKRKLSISEETIALEPHHKQQLLKPEPCLEIAPQEARANLLDLSDEILLLIFQHLDGNSLLPLSSTCTRLQRLVYDKTLWVEANFETSRLRTNEVLLRVKRLQSVTKALKLRGMTSVYPEEHWNVPTLTPAILQTIPVLCPMLTRLELTEAYLDMNEISIMLFPRTLRTLVLRKCALSGQNHSQDLYQATPHVISFLTNIYKHLVRLEELSIEYCAWFDTHDFIALGKLPELRYLSLKGCVNIKDSVPYASLSTRFGFKKLQVLDLRDTPISDSDVSCFNSVKSLRKLLLECPEHLRTEGGLQEYNEAERQRVNQLHRLVEPAVQLVRRNEAGEPVPPAPAPAQAAAAAAPPAAAAPAAPDAAEEAEPPNLPPRHGLVEIRLLGDQGVVVHNYPIAFGRRRSPPRAYVYRHLPEPLADGAAPAQAPAPAPAPADQLLRVNPPAVPPPQQPAAPPPAPAAAAGAPPQDGAEPGENNNNNNNNNVDRQHIVRIVNRDLFLQRQMMDRDDPRRFLRRPVERIHRAYQQIFDGNNNNNNWQNGPYVLVPQAAEPAIPQELPEGIVVRVEGIGRAGAAAGGAAGAAAGAGAGAGAAPQPPPPPPPPPRAGEEEQPNNGGGAADVAPERAAINVQFRYNASANRLVNNNPQLGPQLQQIEQRMQRAVELRLQRMADQQPAAAPRLNPRLIPHVIIIPGPENMPDIIHRAGNGNHPPLFMQASNYVSLVSDRSICSYGVGRNHALLGGMPLVLTGLERLSVRNYKLVTDTSLEHLESAAPHLQFLDVTGTSVTANGVRSFRLSRPSCTVVSDHEGTAGQPTTRNEDEQEQPPPAPPAPAP